LRPYDGVETFRTDPVAEANFPTLGEVGLDLLPIILVVADLLAVGTDRKEPLQPLHIRQGEL
jgi:hypothetical protein